MFINNTLLDFIFSTLLLMFGNVVRHGLFTITCNYFLALSHTQLRFCRKTFLKTAVYANAEPKSTNLKLLAEYF